MIRQPQGLRASVVITSRNRPIQLGKCLESVAAAASAQDEIIVVDSASADPAAIREVVAQSSAQLLRLESAGSARARNAGTRLARGEIIAFTDDDAVVDAEWLNELAGRFADPAVSAVVGPVFELGSEPLRLLRPRVGFDAASQLVTFSRSDPQWFAKLRVEPIGFGANLAVRRSAFDRYGFFRESLGAGAPIGGDENYFLMSLIENGGMVVNEPRARVCHPRQTEERLRATKEARLAYLLYVFFTRPRLRLPLMISVLRRARQRKATAIEAPIRSSGILRELLRTPTLLWQAFRIDRAVHRSGD